MRAQALNALLVDLMRREEALGEYERDPDALAARHGLSAEERERLKAKDMGWLYVHGVHPYILTQFALSIRYDMKQLTNQLREATGYQEAAS